VLDRCELRNSQFAVGNSQLAIRQFNSELTVTTKPQVRTVDELAGPFVLWFSAMAGPLAWIIHNVGRYAWATTVCFEGQTLILHAITVGTGLISLIAAVAGWLAWRRLRRERERVADQARWNRAHFMAIYGLMSSIFFLMVIIAEAIPSFFIDPCLDPKILAMGWLG
jgi:hypothetical protein